eukprot:TRINITY_DN7045_c0_g1_i1.p1 TRINITY_DN7045_c0_g1~~TRINITY_DN7045_c0_g1_i1.p1  ORF type:complete len:219 (-),score=19.58 TRINITY_DN7045_c0_g1_i1:124-780(-)
MQRLQEFKLDDNHYFWPHMSVVSARQTLCNWTGRYCLVHRTNEGLYLTYCPQEPEYERGRLCYAYTQKLETDERSGRYYIQNSEMPRAVELNEFIQRYDLSRIEPLTEDILNSLDKRRWWYGNMSRDIAQDCLKEEENTFLVRLSGNAKSLVLSVCYTPVGKPKQFIHHIIERTSEGFRFAGTAPSKDTVEELLKAYFSDDNRFENIQVQAFLEVKLD